MRMAIQVSKWAWEEAIEKTMYGRRVALQFEWEKGDLLVKENVSMLYTRTGCETGL